MVDISDLSAKVRAGATALISKSFEVPTDFNPALTPERQLIAVLALAWVEAVQAEWQKWVADHPGLQEAYETAVVMMREDGYDGDPVCGLLGVDPSYAMVDGKKAVSFQHSMPQALPLSAIYLDKVKAVVDAVEKVAAARRAASKSTCLSG